MQLYVTWIPEHDGHKPPFLRDDTLATASESWDNASVVSRWLPVWITGCAYLVERAAVHPDATALIAELRKLPAEELAKHGVTLEPENDWAVELFLKVCEISGVYCGHDLGADDRVAIEYIRNNARPLA